MSGFLPSEHPAARDVDVPRISIIITTYNEGPELQRTLASLVANTKFLEEVIVVDDGSSDGSCDNLGLDFARVIRHTSRIGIGLSRDEGSRAARGNVFCYLDSHQRIGSGALDRCAELALSRKAITCPDIRDYGLFRWRLHGADFRLCPERGYFTSTWRKWFQLRGVTQVSGLRAPPYLIPRSVYEDVAWSPGLRGWGASEASVVVKAFFTGHRILHLSGPIVRHRFQAGSKFEVSWDDLYRNQAIIARVCFEDATWFKHWLPRVFSGHLTENAKAVLESKELLAEHTEFVARKVCADRQFWSDLLRISPPDGI